MIEAGHAALVAYGIADYPLEADRDMTIKRACSRFA
jgi:hypothetical protein